MGLADSREGPLGAVGMISKLFRMECFSDGVSPLVIHALQKWGKIGPTSSWAQSRKRRFCRRKTFVLDMFRPFEGLGTWTHILGTNILIDSMPRTNLSFRKLGSFSKKISASVTLTKRGYFKRNPNNKKQTTNQQATNKQQTTKQQTSKQQQTTLKET